MRSLEGFGEEWRIRKTHACFTKPSQNANRNLTPIPTLAVIYGGVPPGPTLFPIRCNPRADPIAEFWMQAHPGLGNPGPTTRDS